MTLSWRPAVKADRTGLQTFTCCEGGAPDHELAVQRYFRSKAIAHLGAPDSLAADQRLLLVLDDEQIVAAACHRRSAEPSRRNLVFLGVEVDHRGVRAEDGRHTSHALWEVVMRDIASRPGDPPTLIVAKVHPQNERCLTFLERYGVRGTEHDQFGLVICTGALATVESAGLNWPTGL